MKKPALIPVLLTLCAAFAFPADFGLLLEQKAEAENKLFTYTPSFTPWFSWNGRNGLSFYLSGLLSMEYKYSDDGIDENNGWRQPVLGPELSIFSIGYRTKSFFFEAGRIIYNDVLSLTACGLFDGFRIQAGGFRFGAFYSGFLYKESAKILMTGEDEASFVKPWGWDCFGDYFASRRIIASLRLDFPLFEYHNLSLEALGQFDLNGNDEKLHSQYGEVLLDLYTKKNVGIRIGAFFEAMENGEGIFSAALGALACFRTNVPGSLNDGFQLTAKFSSGWWNDTFIAFTPVNSIAQGVIFSGDFSGLALFRAGYDLLILPSLLMEMNAAYFLRTYSISGIGNLYGGELWASFTWQPFDDVRLNIGGGAFFPGMGNIYPSGADTMWKVSAGLSISL